MHPLTLVPAAPAAFALRVARLLGATLATVALAGCGGGSGASDSPAAAPRPPATLPTVSPGRWVVLGSSTAAGVGATPGAGWVDRLGTALAPQQVGIVNLARSGLLTTQALPLGAAVPPGGLPPDPAVNVERALAEQPRLLLFSFPTNDAAAGLTPQDSATHLQRLREAAARAPAPAAVMVLSSQPRDAFTAAQRMQLQVYDDLASQAFGACFVALREALSDAQGRIAPAFTAGDGIHLNDAGHALVAERVLQRLRSGECVRLQP